MSFATRLIGAMLVVCAVVFVAAFAYARDNRPELEIEATPTPGLETLPARGAPPAIPVLARADALPAIKVKKQQPKRGTPPASSGASSSAGATTSLGTTQTTGTTTATTNTNSGQVTQPSRTQTTPKTNTNTQKKQDSGIQKTGSGGSVAGGGTPED